LGSIASDGTPSTFIYSSTFSSLNEQRALSIHIGTLYVPGGGRPTDEQFYAFYKTGAIKYSIEAKDGIEIGFEDENGIFWSSNGDQTGSSFSVTKITEEKLWGAVYVNFEATFNCTLYDENGNSMKLLNGSCKTTFENI